MRKTHTTTIGSVKIGHGHAVAIQSMCNTKTEDVQATVAQILALEKEGCDLIRVAVPTKEASAALPKIKSQIHIPLIADIHFHAGLALDALEAGADKIRINPGNIDQNDLLDQIIEKAQAQNTCIRIGVNAGSLEQELWDKYGAPTAEAMVESTLNWLKYFQDRDFNNLVISIKSAEVPTMIRAYELIADQCDIPLHLGVTAAGLLFEGSIKNAIGIGTLLHQGIGDTIRVSLTADPIEEVKAAKEILKSLNLYSKEPQIVSCPTCGRTEIDVIGMTKKVKEMIAREKIQKPLRIAVMGCVVNALGEAKESDFAIAGGRKQGNIYYQGELFKGNIPEDQLLDEFLKLIREKIKA
mgnify:CR=1 FL=1